jgi:hypothetical protein
MKRRFLQEPHGVASQEMVFFNRYLLTFGQYLLRGAYVGSQAVGTDSGLSYQIIRNDKVTSGTVLSVTGSHAWLFSFNYIEVCRITSQQIFGIHSYMCVCSTGSFHTWSFFLLEALNPQSSVWLPDLSHRSNGLKVRGMQNELRKT